jgi:hypothetical protein
VIERIAARLRRLDEHLQIGPRLALADEVGEHERAQARLGIILAAFGGEEAVRGGQEADPDRRRE